MAHKGGQRLEVCTVRHSLGDEEVTAIIRAESSLLAIDAGTFQGLPPRRFDRRDWLLPPVDDVPVMALGRIHLTPDTQGHHDVRFEIQVAAWEVSVLVGRPNPDGVAFKSDIVPRQI